MSPPPRCQHIVSTRGRIRSCFRHKVQKHSVLNVNFCSQHDSNKTKFFFSRGRIPTRYDEYEPYQPSTASSVEAPTKAEDSDDEEPILVMDEE